MEPGEYVIDGECYRVRVSKSGHWYADRLTGEGAVYVGQNVPGIEPEPMPTIADVHRELVGLREMVGQLLEWKYSATG